MALVEADETEAAAAPATTMDNAKMRIASFMIWLPLRYFSTQSVALCLYKNLSYRGQLSPAFSAILQTFECDKCPACKIIGNLTIRYLWGALSTTFTSPLNHAKMSVGKFVKRPRFSSV
jgi:hypothetical protein